MKQSILMLLTILFCLNITAQKQGSIDIKIFNFQNANYSTSGTAGTFNQEENDVNKDTLQYFNDLGQKIIRFEINSQNIKFKYQTFNNGVTSATNTDFYIQLTISRNNVVLRQEKHAFSLFPRSNQDDGKYYYAIILSEKERGMNDGKYIKIKAELYRKGEAILLNSKSKVLLFEGGE